MTPTNILFAVLAALLCIGIGWLLKQLTARPCPDETRRCEPAPRPRCEPAPRACCEPAPTNDSQLNDLLRQVLQDRLLGPAQSAPGGSADNPLQILLRMVDGRASKEPAPEAVTPTARKTY